jgi:indole-3-glycerol phosphate synthase
MNILDTIIAAKFIEVANRKIQYPVALLQKKPAFHRSTISLHQFLMDDTRTGIIAEFKRQSPSKGIINNAADIIAVTQAYANHGAAAISVLTDTDFFGGSTTDLEAARVNNIPILRKDFMVDEYQLIEAKAMGADVILLIAACLSPQRVHALASAAQSLGLEVLLELHDESELEHINAFTPIVGINNRNLKTFTVDIDKSLQMAAQLPANTIKVAESGIDDINQVLKFRENGYRGFLMGELFMKSKDPGQAFVNFTQQLKANIV